MYKSLNSSKAIQPSTAVPDKVMDYLFTKRESNDQLHRTLLRYPSLINTTISVLWETPLTIFQIQNHISSSSNTRHWRTAKVVGVRPSRSKKGGLKIDDEPQYHYLVQFIEDAVHHSVLNKENTVHHSAKNNTPTWIDINDIVFRIIPNANFKVIDVYDDVLLSNQDHDAIKMNLDSIKVDDDSIEVDDDSKEVDNDSKEVDNDSKEVDDDSKETDDDSIKVDDDSIKMDDDSIKMNYHKFNTKQESKSETFKQATEQTYEQMIAKKTAIDHDKVYNQLPTKFTSDTLTSPITTLDQLIQLADDYLDFKILQSRYGRYQSARTNTETIDFDKLINVIEPLIELNNMIGMKEFKNNIMTHVMYHLQSLHGDEMNHIAIEGPPGVGKTTVGKILGKIYHRMGFLTSGKFKIVKSHDLIGQYIGQTAPKTQAVLDECQGGVLFIDEAYTIGNGAGKRDNYFAKDCIDTINQHLSETKNNFLLIVAGYGDQLDKNFFNINPGLERRFPWRYRLDPYGLDEIVDIFLTIVKGAQWKLDNDGSTMLKGTFFKYIKYFTNNGGDCETLFYKCKLAYSQRKFNSLSTDLSSDVTKDPTMKLVDIVNGFKDFIKNKNIAEQYAKKRQPDLMDILNMAR